MAATDEQKAVFSVLKVLLINGQASTRRPRLTAEHPPAVPRRQFTALNASDLERILLYGKRGQFPDGKVIYLKAPPKETSAVAAMWCRWNFDVVPSRFGYYFGVWSRQQAVPNRGDGQECTTFVGFRYETPEEGDNHDYHHAQPCRSMGSGINSRIEYALPISERNPTFPLAAQSSLELLLCLVTSIYGRSGLRELATAVSNQQSMRGNQLLHLSLKKLNSRLRAAPPGEMAGKRGA